MNLQKNMLFANRYRLTRFVGSGGFSEVWQAKDTISDIDIAIKILAPGIGLDKGALDLFRHEFSLMFNLNHSHLLRPTHYDVDNRMPYLIMPFCERGSVEKLAGKFTEGHAWKFLHDVASGLAYLHEQEPPVIHQDIKPDNILRDKQGRYLIADFGLSTKARNTLLQSMNANQQGGTIVYMAPERFEKKNTPIKAGDIWSLGATLFEMLTGDAPFGSDGGLIQKKGAEIPDITGNWSDALQEIVTRCLQKDPWDRPTAKQIVELAALHLKDTPDWDDHFDPEPHVNDAPIDKPERKTPWYQDKALLAVAAIAVIVLFIVAVVKLSPATLEWLSAKVKATPQVTTNRQGRSGIIEPEMVWVQGGRFRMGCTPNQADSCKERDTPAHWVTLSDYHIGKYEVTQAQWKSVMNNNPSYARNDKLPVEQVSWNDVQEFIRKLNLATGKTYRLPTEAEWEFAARGGRNSRNFKYCGSNHVFDVAWLQENSGKETHPVGSKYPNELGLYDMSGNVWEWCNDWYGAYSGEEQTNPKGIAIEKERVRRGGSMLSNTEFARVSSRYSFAPGARDRSLGFRLALTIK